MGSSKGDLRSPLEERSRQTDGPETAKRDPSGGVGGEPEERDAREIGTTMEPPWREGDLRKRYAREAVDAARERSREGRDAERAWMQGVVVEVQTPNRWTLDDGSMTIDVDTQAMQAKNGIVKHVSVGDYVRVIGKGVVFRHARQQTGEPSSASIGVIFKALQVTRMSAPDRDALWMLEVVHSYQQHGNVKK